MKKVEKRVAVSMDTLIEDINLLIEQKYKITRVEHDDDLDNDAGSHQFGYFIYYK